MFDSTLAAWSPFVGDDITTPFDMSNVRIHKMYHTSLRSSGVAATLPSRLVDWWFPWRRRWVIENPTEGALAAPLFGKYSTPYLCIQCYDGVGIIDNTTDINFDFVQTAYWRNIV